MRFVLLIGLSFLILGCVQGVEMPPPESVFSVYGEIVFPGNNDNADCRISLQKNGQLVAGPTSLDLAANRFSHLFTVTSGADTYLCTVECPGFRPVSQGVAVGPGGDVGLLTFPGDRADKGFDFGTVRLEALEGK